jgi:hypothetical protein
MRTLALVVLLGCGRTHEVDKTQPADPTFTLASGARCADLERGTGAEVAGGMRVALSTTTWMDTAPADPLKAHAVADAVLAPGAVKDIVGKGGKRMELLDEILAGTRPMHAGGKRRCATRPDRAGLFKEGIPGWASDTELVVEVSLEKVE